MLLTTDPLPTSTTATATRINISLCAPRLQDILLLHAWPAPSGWLAGRWPPPQPSARPHPWPRYAQVRLIIGHATTCALIEVYMPALPCHIPETDTNADTSSTINQHPHPFLRLSWLPWRIHCHTSGKKSRSTRTWIALPWNAITHTSTTVHVYPVCILSVIKLQYKSCSRVGLKECHRKVLCFSHRFLKHPDGVPICGFLPVLEMRGEHHLLNYSHMNNQFDSDSLYADVVHVCVYSCVT